MNRFARQLLVDVKAAALAAFRGCIYVTSLPFGVVLGACMGVVWIVQSVAEDTRDTDPVENAIAVLSAVAYVVGLARVVAAYGFGP